jgi:hypothetical protein
MNIPSVRGGCFHADGRTKKTKVIVAFRSFADELKIWLKVVKDYYSPCHIIQDLSRLLKFNSSSLRSVVMHESVMNSLLNTDTLLPYVRYETFIGVKICVVWPYGVLHFEFYRVGKYVTSNTVGKKPNVCNNRWSR